MIRATNWVLIFIAYFTLFALGLLDNARGPYFLDITTDLALSGTRASLFFAVTSTVAFFSGRAVPDIIRRWGLLNTIRLGQILMGLGFASISLAQNLTTLMLTCALFGYGFGLINVAQNLLIFDATYGDMRRRLLSGLHGMYAFSSLVSPLVAAQLFEAKIGWRQAFVGFASVGFLSFASTFFAKAQSHSQRDNMPKQERNPNRRAYFIIGSMMSFYITAELVISTRLSLYLRTVFNYSPSAAANFLAVFFLMLLLGRLFFMLVPVKLTSLKIIEFSLIFTFFSFALGLWYHPFFLTICGLTMAPVFGVCIDFIAEHFHHYTADAVASSLALSCVYIVSMHFIMGLITDWLGIRLAMFVGLGSLLVSYSLLHLFIWRQKHVAQAIGLSES